MSQITDEFYPLPPAQFIYVYGSIVANSIALFCIAFLIFCILRQRQIQIDTLYILSIMIGDILFSLQSLIFVVLLQMNGGWSFGIFACKLQVIVVIFAAGIVILSIIGLTAYRFLIIIYNYHLTEKAAKISIACIYIGLIIVIATYVGAGASRAVGLQHGTYCFLLANSTDPIAQAAASLVVVCLLSPSLFLPVAYFAIIRKYMAKKRSTMYGAVAQPNVNPAEWKLIKLSCAITSAYWITWTPFAIKLLWELISHNPVSLEYEIFASFLALVDPLANTVLILVYDAKIYREVIEVLGLERYFAAKRVRKDVVAIGALKKAIKVKDGKLDLNNMKTEEMKATVLIATPGPVQKLTD